MSQDIAIRLSMPRAGFALEVDLQLPGQGITVLFGASGSGKTSLLRAVAGLERARSGLVRIGPQVWQDDGQGLWMPTHRRPLGYVFQEASLFEHLDVRGNLLYGLKRAARSGAQPQMGGAPGVQMKPQPEPVRDVLAAAVDLLGIGHLLDRRPAQLSGGERQRVAIARALATQPRLLLLDEPLASLDPARRREILPWLERLRDESRVPMLYVTHSIDELARLADHVVVLEAGRVKEQGAAAEVMSRGSGALAQSDEAGALLHARVVDRSEAWQLARTEFDGGHLWLRDTGLAIGSAVRLRILARDVSLALHEPQGISVQNVVPAVVQALEESSSAQVMVRLRCGPTVILSRITRRAAHELSLAQGMPVWAMIKAVAVVA